MKSQRKDIERDKLIEDGKIMDVDEIIKQDINLKSQV